MSIYNPKSLKAEEFINHEEILETIEYAEKNNPPGISESYRRDNHVLAAD